MADFDPSADEAARYVLGEPGAAERSAFEARLKQSAELRALVRELEAGAIAVALAVPTREAPPHVLQQIEAAVAKEAGRKLVSPVFWPAWWRNGWAAAAACLVGWLLFAVWMNRHSAPVNSSPPLADERAASGPSSTGSRLAGGEGAPRSPPTTVVTNVVRPFPRVSPLARAGEIAALERQLAELGNQVSNLSQALTQHQALGSGASRLAFFHLVPPGVSTNEGWVPPPPSPELQRALLIAMARELGWLRAPDAPADSQNSTPGPARTESQGVDFVDLPPAGRNQPRDPLPQPGGGEAGAQSNLQAQLNPAAGNSPITPPPDSSSPSLTSTAAVPVIASGTRLIVGLDSSVVPAGVGQVTLFIGTSGGALQSVGTVALGVNPLVVTYPFAGLSADGLNVALSAGSQFFSLTNAGGLFFPPGTNAP